MDMQTANNYFIFPAGIAGFTTKFPSKTMIQAAKSTFFTACIGPQ